MFRKDSPSRRGGLALHTATGLSLFSLVYLAVSLFATSAAHDIGLPTPSLSPQQVIQIQLGALRDNTLGDEGIAVAYRFASPDNRYRTGSLERFASMIRSERYLPLLNHLGVQYGDTVGHSQRSYTPVILTDQRGISTAFLWVLSRQDESGCSGCWMTDSVVPIGLLHGLRLA